MNIVHIEDTAEVERLFFASGTDKNAMRSLVHDCGIASCIVQVAGVHYLLSVVVDEAVGLRAIKLDGFSRKMAMGFYMWHSQQLVEKAKAFGFTNGRLRFEKMDTRAN